MRQALKSFAYRAAVAAYLAQCALAADAAIHVRNFGQVNQHIFRGGEPTPADLKELAAMHVSMVIDLREPGVSREAERRLVKELGMQYVNVPFPRLSAPSPDEMNRVLALMLPDDSGRIFVHCWRGKDRTGTVVACYRIQHDGWNSPRALEEAGEYGMSRMERSMRSFIAHFHPVDLPPPTASAP